MQKASARAVTAAVDSASAAAAAAVSVFIYQSSGLVLDQVGNASIRNEMHHVGLDCC